MSNSHLDLIWSTYTISPDPQSGTPTLHDTCTALLSYPTLSSSDLIPGPAGFTLHPRLAKPLHDIIPVVQSLTINLGLPAVFVDSVDLKLVFGPTSMDWRATLAWARVVRQLAEALRLVETCCADPSRLDQATRRATLASPTWVQPSVSATPSKAPADASWWTSPMAPPTPFKSTKRFFKDLVGHTAPLESAPVVRPEPNILFRLGAGPMSSVGDAFVRKFGNVPALDYSTSAPNVAPASRSHPSDAFELPAVAWSPSAHAARPASSAPRREVPSRQVGRTVEEFLDNDATCRAESAPTDGGVVLAKSVTKGLAIKQKQWLGTHKSIVAAPARRASSPIILSQQSPPPALLVSTPIARIARPVESAPAREVHERLAGRVQEVLDSGATRRVETVLADGRDPVRGSDMKQKGSMGTHRCASPSASPDWRATVRAPSSSPSSRPSTADSFISWRSTRTTSPASTASSWQPRRLDIQGQKIEDDAEAAHGVEQESCSPGRRHSTASESFGGLDEEARRAQRRDVEESRLSSASRASVYTEHISKRVRERGENSTNELTEASLEYQRTRSRTPVSVHACVRAPLSLGAESAAAEIEGLDKTLDTNDSVAIATPTAAFSFLDAANESLATLEAGGPRESPKVLNVDTFSTEDETSRKETSFPNGEKEPIANEVWVSKESEQKERIREDHSPPDESCPPSAKTESVMNAGAALSYAGALCNTTTRVDSAKSEIEVLEAGSIQLLNNEWNDWPLTAEHARDSTASIPSGTTSTKALEREPLLPNSSTDVEGVSTMYSAMEVEGLKESWDDFSKESCEDNSLKLFLGNGESPIRISGSESAMHPAIRTEDSGAPVELRGEHDADTCTDILSDNLPFSHPSLSSLLFNLPFLALGNLHLAHEVIARRRVIFRNLALESFNLITASFWLGWTPRAGFDWLKRQRIEIPGLAAFRFSYFNDQMPFVFVPSSRGTASIMFGGRKSVLQRTNTRGYHPNLCSLLPRAWREYNCRFGPTWRSLHWKIERWHV
ncbi:hypothetical protein B0H11DRAFT_1930290 [Mycena galericulata]|nr:hypothetical protein B0H11DRAFT_1930290 [Mycena galericulata]